MNVLKAVGVVAFLCVSVSILARDENTHREIEESALFDSRSWDGLHNSFTHYRNTSDLVVRPLNGAGLLPVVKDTDGRLYFLLSVAIVENGTDEAIGSDPVYTNPSNYPLVDPKDRLTVGGTWLPYETSIDMAARPEELGIISPLLSSAFFKERIHTNGYLLPNAGMWYGRYAVPTYLVYCGYIADLSRLLAHAAHKIATQEYDQLFPTESSMKRSDKIVKFECIPACKLIQAVKDQGSNRIERPLAIEGCAYKLSPYVARTIALTNNFAIIEEALIQYQELT